MFNGGFSSEIIHRLQCVSQRFTIKGVADSPNIKTGLGGPPSPEVTETIKEQAKQPSKAEQIIQEEDQARQKVQARRSEAGRTDRKQSSTQEKSQFQQTERNAEKTQVNQRFGKKINVNPNVARQNQQPQQPQQQRPVPQNRGLMQQQSQAQPQKPLPQAPQSQDFQNLLQSSLFRGNLRGSTLHQNVQQAALQQTQPQNTAPKDGRFRENFNRTELGRLASMRNNPDMTKELKESLRRMLKFEIAKANRNRAQLKSIQYQTEHNRQRENPDALIKSERSKDKDSSTLKLMDKLARSAESIFERILQKVLASGKSPVEDLPEGADPTLPTKSSEEWLAFFENASRLNSEQVKAKGEFQKMIEAMFRGVFESKDGLRLVSDLAFSEDGDVAQYKFTQIALQDGKLLQLLQSLKPGQKIPAEWIRLLGEEIAFLKLAHMVPGYAEMSDREKEALLRSFRKDVSTGYQKDLERALSDSRKKRESEKKKEPFVWAGDQFDKKEERKGLQTAILWMIYMTGGAAVAIGVYYLINAF